VLHELSPRRDGQFIVVRGSQLETTQHAIANEEGSFPWENNLWNFVERAEGGTLLIDEVEDLQPAAQQLVRSLARAVPKSSVTPRPRARIVFSTREDLNQLVATGALDPELHMRMSAITLTVPPLRSRRDDIPLISDYLLARLAGEFKSYPPRPSEIFREVMQRYDWPGNVRELSNVIRGYVLTRDEEAAIQQLQMEEGGDSDPISTEIDITKPISLKSLTRKATRDLEKQIILKVLRSKGWNRQKTAEWLHISYRSLLYKLDNMREEGDQRVPERRRYTPSMLSLAKRSA
jgi:two-component system, NtrC family, response regulator AtoC